MRQRRLDVLLDRDQAVFVLVASDEEGRQVLRCYVAVLSLDLMGINEPVSVLVKRQEILSVLLFFGTVRVG